LGLPERGYRSPTQLLKTYLRDKQFLLMLDTFEQVLLAAPLLADLLSSCPQLKILVTSRALLHIGGEYEFTLQPLEVPDMQPVPEHERLSRVASVALFVQRTQTMLPGFQLTDENARDIAEICTRLEGVPLAIELAAAQSKLLPPRALLTRLEHPLEVLTGGRRDAPARQQTLLKTLDWNDDLLSPDEQTLFRRLAVFVGGCSLQAVEAVSPRGLMISVLDGVRSLVDKSLLWNSASGEDEPHLSLFEMIRVYALKRLVECGELEQTRDAHADYYLALAEKAASALPGTDKSQAAWRERLEREVGNLRAALEWLLERRQVEEALRMATALELCWLCGDYLSEGRGFLEQALAASCESKVHVSTRVKARARRVADYLVENQKDRARTIDSMEESERLSRQLQDIYEELTGREIGVLRLLAMGLSNKQIAERLVLSPYTVSGYTQSIFGKLGLNSRSAATRYALEHHLV
ncbi:MAG TPA: LuxR C-terminal-related transcriptional regulator, partial [Ktedonobacteraceae bacterium]